MTKFNAEIEIKNGQIYITPDGHNNSYMLFETLIGDNRDSYMLFETFIWDNRDKKVDEIINVLPF